MNIKSQLKLNLNGKILCLADSVKHVGIKPDENLNRKQQICDIAIKLNRANVISSKLRHFIDRNTQFVMQYLNLIYVICVWTQNINSSKILVVVQRNLYRLFIFEVVMFIHIPHSENPKF